MATTTKNLSEISLINISDNINLIAENDGKWARIKFKNVIDNLITDDQLNGKMEDLKNEVTDSATSLIN